MPKTEKETIALDNGIELWIEYSDRHEPPKLVGVWLQIGEGSEGQTVNVLPLLHPASKEFLMSKIYAE